MSLYDQFVLFGDSLIQHSSSQDRGFSLTPALQAGKVLRSIDPEYIRRLDVVNRGFSGYNTDQALTILPRIIGTTKIRFLLVFFGANDACLKGAQGSQHVPLEQYKANLQAIVTHPSVTAHQPRIIIVTPPPMNEYLAEENDAMKGITQPRRKAEHTKMYADAAREVAAAEGIACLDLWTAFMRHVGWHEGLTVLPGSKAIPPNPFLRMLLHDGLHFTSIAYTLFHQELMRVIAATWPEQMPEKLPFVLPAWNDQQWM